MRRRTSWSTTTPTLTRARTRRAGLLDARRRPATSPHTPSGVRRRSLSWGYTRLPLRPATGPSTSTLTSRSTRRRRGPRSTGHAGSDRLFDVGDADGARCRLHERHRPHARPRGAEGRRERALRALRAPSVGADARQWRLLAHRRRGTVGSLPEHRLPSAAAVSRPRAARTSRSTAATNSPAPSPPLLPFRMCDPDRWTEHGLHALGVLPAAREQVRQHLRPQRPCQRERRRQSASTAPSRTPSPRRVRRSPSVFTDYANRFMSGNFGVPALAGRAAACVCDRSSRCRPVPTRRRPPHRRSASFPSTISRRDT